MSFLAVCPFCHQGKVRAPDTAIGMSATCPNCHNCFTLVASKEPAAKTQGLRAAAAAATIAPTKPVLSDATPLPAAIDDDGPVELRPLPAEPTSAREKVAFASYRPEPEPEAESIFSLAMVAFALAGAASVASQITHYGRFGTVGLAMLGVVLSFLGLISAFRGRRWPALALGVNVVIILLVTILPSWLALDSWWPRKVVSDRGMTKVRPLDGGAASMLEGGWLDVSKGAWQRDDVLVTFTSAWVSKVELVGPKGNRKYSKDKLLQIGLKFTNIGAARRIEYRSWQQQSPPDAQPLVATDSTGKALAPAKFEDVWAPSNYAKDGAMLPGKNHEDLLIFDAPDPQAEYVRLELPILAFGDRGQPIRLHIPKSLIAARNIGNAVVGPMTTGRGWCSPTGLRNKATATGPNSFASNASWPNRVWTDPDIASSSIANRSCCTSAKISGWSRFENG